MSTTPSNDRRRDLAVSVHVAAAATVAVNAAFSVPSWSPRPTWLLIRYLVRRGARRGEAGAAR